MHATSNVKGFVVTRMQVGLVAAGILASTLAGAAVVTRTHATTPNVAAPSSAPAEARMSDWRFQEANQLPVVAAAPSIQRLRFLEINQLPLEAALSRPLHNHLLEINQLPGGDVRL